MLPTNFVHARQTMANDSAKVDEIDWSLTTWEGARKEQLRRWSQMPLREIISALEEMQELSGKLSRGNAGQGP